MLCRHRLWVPLPASRSNSVGVTSQGVCGASGVGAPAPEEPPCTRMVFLGSSKTPCRPPHATGTWIWGPRWWPAAAQAAAAGAVVPLGLLAAEAVVRWWEEGASTKGAPAVVQLLLPLVLLPLLVRCGSVARTEGMVLWHMPERVGWSGGAGWLLVIWFGMRLHGYGGACVWGRGVGKLTWWERGGKNTARGLVRCLRTAWASSHMQEDRHKEDSYLLEPCFLIKPGSDSEGYVLSVVLRALMF